MSPHVDVPIAGWYRRKLTRGGPYVGVVLYYSCPFHFENDNMTVDRSRPLLCLVNGEHADAMDQWTWIAGSRITEAEYSYLMADASHALEFRPSAPRANPRKTIDLMDSELPF